MPIEFILFFPFILCYSVSVIDVDLQRKIKKLKKETQNSITGIAIASSEGGPPPSFAIEKTIKAQFSPITSRIELDKNKESVKGVALKDT